MVDHSLDSTYAKFQNKWYKMVDCVPTGHTLSVHLADIAVYYAFYRLIYCNHYIDILLMCRFVDDGSMLWDGSLESFHWWVTCFQELLSHQYGLNITYEVSNADDWSVFLDVKFKFINGKLITNIYHKPTDAHLFLHYSSCHPRHVFRSIVYSQGLRYRRIINDDSTLNDSLETLAGYFMNCGYPSEMIRPILDSVKDTPRSLEYKPKPDSDNDGTIRFMYPYVAGALELKHHVDNSVNDALGQAPIFSDVSSPIIKTVYTRGPTLGSSLFRQSKVTLGSSSGMSTRCTTEDESKHKRGAKCRTCPLMANSDTVKINGVCYNDLEGGTCKSRNIIYLAQCKKCNRSYIGKTSTPLHKRVNGHRNNTMISDLITDEQALVHHATTVHMSTFDGTYRFFVVMNVGNPTDLLKWELYFIDKFNTKIPKGLNIDNPMGLRLKRLCI